MADELKPCPFCGGAAEMDTARAFRELRSGNVSTAVAIYCVDCSADICLCRADMPDLTTADLVYQVLEQWNRRTGGDHG